MKFKKYFQEKILSARKLKHRGNNVLYKVTTENGDYLLKQYSNLYSDHWNKAKKEFEAISTLFKKGFSVPKPIKFDEVGRVGIYSFEPGRVLSPLEVNSQDIEKIAKFLARIHSLDSERKNQLSKYK